MVLSTPISSIAKIRSHAIAIVTRLDRRARVCHDSDRHREVDDLEMGEYCIVIL
jgi:hypothetical protein